MTDRAAADAPGTRRVVILGALSAMAEALARLCAARGDALVLAARNPERLDRLRQDLVARGAAACETRALDLAETDDVGAAFGDMVAALGGRADAVFLFYGVLGDQRAEERDLAAARRSIRVNFASAAEWCLAAAALLERQGAGALVVAGSVAGDRGRQSNYVYGASKAGLAVLVEGIAHRLAPTGARAAIARLGFVDTPMTAHVEKKGLLWAEPEGVARRLLRIADGRGGPSVYVPWFWRWIMLIIRNVPAAILHRTRL
jgi:decaprenylphospho-beta-D-erythro-pentofuranosid-2-ulose 2-reductase